MSFPINQPKVTQDVKITQFYHDPLPNDSFIIPTTLTSPIDTDSTSPEFYDTRDINIPYHKDVVYYYEYFEESIHTEDQKTRLKRLLQS